MKVEEVTPAEFLALDTLLSTAVTSQSRPKNHEHLFDVFLRDDGARFGVSARRRFPVGFGGEDVCGKGRRVVEDGGRVVWEWRLDDYGEVCGVLGGLGRVNGVSGGVRRLWGVIGRRRDVIGEGVVRDVVGEGFWGRLKGFQREGVVGGAEMGGRFLLGDEMGLGKTVQALGVVRYFGCESGVLVLCPGSLKGSWKEAIGMWNEEIGVGEVRVVASRKDGVRLFGEMGKKGRDIWDRGPGVRFVVCAYDMMASIVREMGVERFKEGGLFKCVIADECHNLRNMHTDRVRFCLPAMMGIKHRILCTGTPVLSRPRELYPLLILICNEDGEEKPILNFEDYAERYCGGSDGGYNGVSNLDELNTVLKSVMIRRTKADVLRSLPPKRRRHVVLDIGAKPLTKFAKVFDELGTLEMQLQDGSLDPAERAAISGRRKGLFAILYVMTAKAKLPGIVTRTRQLLHEDGSKKILVFASHIVVLDAVTQLMEREQVEYIRLDGATKPEERSELVDSFQNNANIRVAILSVHVAGAGLTLTKADVVFFAELHMVPGVLRQAEDRAHRIGRVGVVDIEYAVAPKTLDDRMWSMIRRKMGTIGMVVDGLGDYETGSKTLDPESKDLVLSTSSPAMQNAMFEAESYLPAELSSFDDVACPTRRMEYNQDWPVSKRLKVS